jgi:hypothetical protein
MKSLSQQTIKNLNAISCLSICIVLIIAQSIQLYLYELPCPLCLLQRVGFLGIAFGFLLNAYDTPRPFYYFTSMISAIFTLSVGLRQVLLHIVPNTGVYGSPILGLHLYTWSVVLGSAFLVWIIILLLLNGQQFSQLTKETKEIIKHKPVFTRCLFGLLMLLALTNTITTFGICGLTVCPSDPTQYIWS